MATTTQPDIPVQITVPNDTNPTSGAPLLRAERRITPSWTISQLKTKLEPVTGIPASAQSLRTRGLDGSWISLADESLVGDPRNGLHRYSEIEILDSRPVAARQTINFNDLSSVEKYQMPESQYEKLEDSVLAWKRRQGLGRFDPHTKDAQSLSEERFKHDSAEIERRQIKIDMRCRVVRDDGRRGTVRYVGEIPGLGGVKEAGCVWVGVELDEPVGRNDGSVVVEGEDGEVIKRRVFQCGEKFGVFARPEKVEVGEWPVLDDLVDEDMEEV